MAEDELVTRLRLEGADTVKTGIAEVRAGVKDYTDAVERARKSTFDWSQAAQTLRTEQGQMRQVLAQQTRELAFHADQAKASGSAVGNLVGSVKASHQQFMTSVGSATSFGSALGLISSAATAAVSPIGLLVVSIGAVVGVMIHMANTAVGLYKEMRELSTVTGGTAADAEKLKNTFALAAIGTEKLSFAMFRLSAGVETGGKELVHMGVNIRTASGDLKETGVIFDEVRDKISKMSSSSERAAAAAQIFSMRQARGLMPILSMSAERYAELSKKAEENAAITDELMDKTKQYIEVQEDLSQKLEQAKIRFTNMIALPVATKLEEWAVSALKFVQLLKHAYDIAGVGMLGPLLTGAAKAKQVQQEQAELAAGLAKQNDERIAKGIAQNKRLMEAEIKERLERGRVEDEMTTLQLKGEQAALAEESKMRTGSDQAAIQSRIVMNEKLIEMAEQRYTRERALAEERVSKTTGGKLTPEEEIKLEKDRDVAIQHLRQENAKALVDIEKARVAESQRVAADEIKALKEHNAEILVLAESVAKRQIATLEMSTKSTQDIAAERYQIERQLITDTKNLKLIEINEEKGRLEALAEANKGNYAVQRQVHEQIMALSQQRVQTEQAADVQIIEQRKKMVSDLQNLAREEAGIGDTLTNKAIENLRKRGKTRVSEADVMQESARIQRTGAETIGAFGAGGRVSMDKLQETMAMKGTFESMAKGGFGIGGAIQQSVAQTGAAYAGQRRQFAPTGTDPAMLQQLGMGGGAPIMGVQVEGMQKRIATAGDKAIGLILERIPDIMEGWMVKMTDGLVRKLEFEAART